MALRHSRWQGKNRGSYKFPGGGKQSHKGRSRSQKGICFLNSSPETKDTGEMVSKIREKYFLSRSIFIQTINQVFHSSQLPSYAFPHHLLQNFSTLSASYSIPAIPASFLFLRVFHYLIHIFTITSVYCQNGSFMGLGIFLLLIFGCAGSSLLCLRFLWLRRVGAAL